MEIDIRIITWLLENSLPIPGGLEEISTMGSGPLEELELDDILQNIGIQVYLPSKENAILVLGREDWNENILDEVLDGRSGLQLRVYSQEMFLAYLITGKDPLAEDDDQVRSLACDHPALNYLEAVGFIWPTTQVPYSGGGRFDAELLRIGLLKHMGYTVGKSGLKANARHRILANVYTNQIPNVFPRSYINEWGSPRSSKRLKKMANSLATFCKNNKKKENCSQRAISDWEADLAWLKVTYYDGHYRFQWPSTDVW